MKSILALAALLFAMGGAASAATFTSDHCAGGCGPQPNGFAEIIGIQAGPNTVGITVNLLNNNAIVTNSGLHAFTFNLVRNQTVTYIALSPLFDPIGTTTITQAPGAIQQDNFGTFQYGLDYLGGAPFRGTLSFLLISPTGIALSDFTKLSTGGEPSAYMTIDLLSGTTGRSGAVDLSTTPFPTPVPLPAALPLFVAGIGCIGWISRKRKAALA